MVFEIPEHRPIFDEALEAFSAATTPAKADEVLRRYKNRLTKDEYRALLEAGESKYMAWSARKAARR